MLGDDATENPVEPVDSIQKRTTHRWCFAIGALFLIPTYQYRQIRVETNKNMKLTLVEVVDDILDECAKLMDEFSINSPRHKKLMCPITYVICPIPGIGGMEKALGRRNQLCESIQCFASCKVGLHFQMTTLA